LLLPLSGDFGDVPRPGGQNDGNVRGVLGISLDLELRGRIIEIGRAGVHTHGSWHHRNGLFQTIRISNEAAVDLDLEVLVHGRRAELDEGHLFSELLELLLCGIARRGVSLLSLRELSGLISCHCHFFIRFGITTILAVATRDVQARVGTLVPQALEEWQRFVAAAFFV
jgi:hypothetical protein